MNSGLNNISENNPILIKPRVLVLVFTACFSFWLSDFWKPINVYNRESVFENNEVFNYYYYLPSVFYDSSFIQSADKIKQKGLVGPENQWLPRYNYGMALMYFPFFTAAHIRSTLWNIPPENGFSPLYASYLHWGSLIYVILGLYFAGKFLSLHFREKTVALTLFLCLYGSLLFYYAFSQSELPQAHLFFLFSLFLFLTQKWHQNADYLYTSLLGLVLGIISLIDFFEIYIVVFFLFHGVRSFETLKIKLIFFDEKQWHLLILLLTFLLMWVPQLLYNYLQTGYLFYEDSTFKTYNFLNAGKAWFLLLSYRHGWITYAPLVAAALAGIWFLKPALSYSKGLFIFIILIVLLVYGSLCDFEQGGYFGARRLGPCIAWLSFPLGAIINFLFYNQGRRILRVFFIIFSLSCVCLMMAQSHQVNNRRIEPNTMTSKKYWSVFRTFKFASD